MDTIAMATEDKAKEKDQLANKRTTKDSTVMRMEKEKDKERKPAKETGHTTGCYRCGQPGHTAKDCKVAVYNI